GLHWEHCVSEDLINWVRLPPAIMPTPGWLDADGCFTGNIRVDPKTGTPTLFYTGEIQELEGRFDHRRHRFLNTFEVPCKPV
ncbi:hypothetical protein DUNSADRAFT_6069, partial [Dunaliella salina]